MNTSESSMEIKQGIKKRRDRVIIALIIGALIFLSAPYLYDSIRYSISPDERERARFSDSPYTAVITISNFVNQEEFASAREIIEARIDWVHNQKNDWDKSGGRRSYTLDLSHENKIVVIFGYEEGFDISTFANEITKAADLLFVDSNNNQALKNNDIVYAFCLYQGETQEYEVGIKLTEAGMQHFLAFADKTGAKDIFIQVFFEGSIPSDIFTIEAIDHETLNIKGFINIGAANSLVKLIELQDLQNGLKVDLRTK